MDSTSISFRIEATKDAGEVVDLQKASCDFLVAVIRKNVKHKSAAEILSYLDDVKADSAGSSSEQEICFAFLSPASACDVQMRVAAHWFELAIALAWKEVSEICKRHGYKAKSEPGATTALSLANAKREVVFVANGGSIVGVVPEKDSVVVQKDNEGDQSLEEAELSKVVQKNVLAAAKSRRCACVFCAKIRAKKATVPRPKTPAADKSAEPGTLKHFKSLATALRAPERCGSLEDVPRTSSLTLPKTIATLRHIQRLKLGHLTNLSPELFSLTTLESLSFSYGTIGIPVIESELTAAIAKLVHLRELCIFATFTKLPEELGDLSQLELLSLSSSNLSELPKSVTRLAKLRTLKLGGAQHLTKVLPDLGMLTELEHLDLERVSKPAGVLDRIDFSRMTKLRELNLRRAGLVELPSTLENMPALEVLDLSNQHLARLPEAVAWPRLRVLRLDGTKMTSLPAWIGELPALEELDIHECTFTVADVDALRSARPTLTIKGRLRA